MEESEERKQKVLEAVRLQQEEEVQKRLIKERRKIEERHPSTCAGAIDESWEMNNGAEVVVMLGVEELTEGRVIYSRTSPGFMGGCKVEVLSCT